MHPWVVRVHMPSTQEPREEPGVDGWWSVLAGAEGYLGGGSQGCGWNIPGLRMFRNGGTGSDASTKMGCEWE